MLVMVHVRCVERAHACVLRGVCVCGRCVCVCACVFLSVRTGKRLGPPSPTPFLPHMLSSALALALALALTLALALALNPKKP